VDALPAGSDKTGKKSKHLGYGQGQREQYGEGHGYRPSDLTEGADRSTDHDWAGGDDHDRKVAPSETASAGRPDKSVPKP
jgi:hypothetical protein